MASIGGQLRHSCRMWTMVVVVAVVSLSWSVVNWSRWRWSSSWYWARRTCPAIRCRRPRGRRCRRPGPPDRRCAASPACMRMRQHTSRYLYAVSFCVDLREMVWVGVSVSCVAGCVDVGGMRVAVCDQMPTERSACVCVCEIGLLCNFVSIVRILIHVLRLTSAALISIRKMRAVDAVAVCGFVFFFWFG